MLLALSLPTFQVHALNLSLMNWFNTKFKSRFNIDFKQSYSKTLFIPSRTVSPRLTHYGSTYDKLLFTIKYGNQSVIMLPEIGTVRYNPSSFQKYRVRQLYWQATQQKQTTTHKAHDYQTLTPTQAYQKVQELMEECMLNLDTKNSFSYYIDEVLKITAHYPDELCTQLNIKNIEELQDGLREVREAKDTLKVINKLSMYWGLLPETVRSASKLKLYWNLRKRLSY